MRIAFRALPVLVALLSAAPSFAQSLVCHPIRRGESAGQAARRVTGDSRNMYLASFQIMNGASRFIPKSQYNRLGAGWRACVVRPPGRRTASNGRRLDPPAVIAVAESVTSARDGERAADEADTVLISDGPVAVAPPIAIATPDPLLHLRVSAQPAASISPRRIGDIDLTMVWLGVAIAVPWFGLQFVDGYLTRRRTAWVLRQYFASQFIREFERPLIRYDDRARPLKAHVRRARRGGFDILLAPGPGRRYPNFSDHKRNVEYDVDRVLRALGDHAFVTGALYTQAGWVVVPFQPRTGPKQPGVTCRSSF